MSCSMLALVVLLGLGHIVARTRGQARLGGVLKPLPIALLVAVTLRADGGEAASYRSLVAAALLASMAGDVFLLSPRRFVPGLASFLVAHLLYIAAFAPAAQVDAAAFVLLVPFVAFAAVVLRHLWPHLGHDRVAVCIYVAVIVLMGWLALLRAVGGEVAPDSGGLALVGAVAFMASDTTLASDRFVRPFRGAEVVVMGTYYLAQFLLTLSAVV